MADVNEADALRPDGARPEKFAGARLQTDTEPASGGPPDLLRHLTREQVSHVFLHARRKTYDRGKMLFSQGQAHDGIYLIESGRVRVFYIAPSAREITLAYWHPGNFVGGPEVFGRGVHVWSGVAATNVVALHLPGSALKSLAGQIPALAMGLIEGLSFKGKCYSAMAQMLGTRSVTERLAHLLLHLADLYGARTSEGVLIATRFSHQDLANMVGATRQWITMSLKKLDQQGVVALGRGSITLCRPETLARMRNGDADRALVSSA